MKVGNVDSYSRLNHQVFVSSLRGGPILSSRTHGSPSKKYMEWIDGIIAALLCSNNKVDIMKMMKLDKLHECELDFLKSAVSPLYYASGLYRTKERESITLLKGWAGYPVIGDLSGMNSSKEVQISKNVFKNTLLKLFMNNTKDYRVTRMKEFLDGCPPTTSAVEMYNSNVRRCGIERFNGTISINFGEYQECREAKPGRVRNNILSEYEYSPKTTVGKLKYILDLPATYRSVDVEVSHRSEHKPNFDQKCMVKIPSNRYNQHAGIDTKKGHQGCSTEIYHIKAPTIISYIKPNKIF